VNLSVVSSFCPYMILTCLQEGTDHMTPENNASFALLLLVSLKLDPDVETRLIVPCCQPAT